MFLTLTGNIKQNQQQAVSKEQMLSAGTKSPKLPITGGWESTWSNVPAVLNQDLNSYRRGARAL